MVIDDLEKQRPAEAKNTNGPAKNTNGSGASHPPKINVRFLNHYGFVECEGGRFGTTTQCTKLHKKIYATQLAPVAHAYGLSAVPLTTK